MIPDCKNLILFKTKLFSSRKKSLLSIKVLLVLSIIFITNQSVWGQGRITISGKQLTLSVVLQQIESQTGYTFWMEDGAVDKSRRVDIEVSDIPLDQLLGFVFRNQPVTYKVIGQTIVVKSGPVISKKQVIQGIVVSDGQPVESASVQLKGSLKGVITNTRGAFLLTANPGDTILVVSCVGYEIREVNTVDNKFLQIEIHRTVQQLDEPVVIGYGTTSRRSNPGSVGTLSSGQIDIQPVTNPLLALQGRIPGLYIQQTTGLSDGGIIVNIGGQSSVESNNTPLFVVDEVPFSSNPLIQTGSSIVPQGSPLSYIHPLDIENISVLKDADATAIYGSRGANGVILISTKRGGVGRNQMSATSELGIGKIGTRMKLLNTAEYLMMRREAFANDQVQPDPNVDDDLLSWDTIRNVDWQKELIGKTGYIMQDRLSVSGGSKAITYYAAGSYRKETTTFPGNFYNKKGFINSNISTTWGKRKIALNCSLLGTIDDKTLPYEDPTSIALRLQPNAPPGYNPDGSYNWASGYRNPFAALHQLYKAHGSNLIVNTGVTYSPWKGVRLKTNLGLTSTNINEITPVPVSTIDPTLGLTTSYSTFGKSRVTSWIIEPQFEYVKYLGPGKMTFFLGATLQGINRSSELLYATGYTDPAALETTDGAASITTVDKMYTEYKYMGFYMRLRYDFYNRYIAEVTGRRDGSSRFAPERQFGTFGAFGLAWLFTEEPWFKFKKRKLLNFGKLKISYGNVGNDQIGDYKYLSAWSPLIYTYSGIVGLSPTRLYNSDYGWESSRKINFGFEGTLMKDRIQFSINYYRATTFNQLVRYPLSSVTGFPSLQGNLPAVIKNTAIEFELTTINVRKRLFTWTISANVTLPRNRLTSFPKLAASDYATVYTIGKSVYSTKAFHFTGVDKNTGAYTFEDTDKDGQISFPNDLTSYKNVSKSVFGGILNEFSYKQFSVSLFIQLVKQNGFNYIYNNRGLTTLVPGTSANQPKYVMTRWRQKGMNTNVQRFTQQGGSDAYNAYGVYLASDAGISDASFLRLKNISLSYLLKKQHLITTTLPKIKFMLQVQNLFTLSSYNGEDPEIQTNFGIPVVRVLLMGVEMNF
ncbi:SusC/RagA family TonB-linked outer membrane protein [[Flexibacter] sp. ATCC 35208]|uniref:SusC/RagA family TonB-linked outer membrane protein n=1 Tax=[Flexibacter] sp. ATCC 35208 TaxID=1936242 RepID=UPI0009C69BE8|nr:SusC/RagA family TonB-linked outer membrane protein [[Flexibacter] sp. ATCC 35208]OMP80053.1 hypothetical protein BW716_06050 [[Flexibacter] sp. ATCC 35208]